MKCIKLYAYQLEIGYKIALGGRYSVIQDIRGAYERGRGLVVEIRFDVLWYRLFANSMVEVYFNE